MTAPLLLILPLLAQLAPPLSPGAAPPLNLPIGIERPAPRAAVTPTPKPSRTDECVATAQGDALAGIDAATAWRDSAKPEELPFANYCLGLGLTRVGRFAEATAAFIAARDATPATQRLQRARIGAMAGNAALADGDAGPALDLLDTAHGFALTAGDQRLGGEIALDQARAFVALGRQGEAAMALDEACLTIPDNAAAWLLSATLSRRMGKLAEAQARIERAASLMPIDPEIGLEAGVIAVLSGRDEAARRSWQSVLTAAPGSDAARTAQGYLDQLGPAPATAGR